ncbi:MAG: polysaccharide deacetylase [Eubacteriales bacterium]|nr:polysaccharide deacetylase [Eubacteriales bacterium]
MYFGSVRFFKHLIVAVVLLLIIALSISTVFLLIHNNELKELISELKADTVFAQSALEEVRVRQNSTGAYQELYPEMFVEPAEAIKSDPDTVYLTFDDGPSARTTEILDILAEKKTKATFFIIGKEGEKQKEIMRRIVDEGHIIGIHTYSHVYDNIYSSVESYLADFNMTYNLIYETTGVKPEVFRFPGGSINQYNSLIYEEIIAEMTRRGFTYYDWNASSGDADSKATSKSVYDNSVRTSKDKKQIILLMHDSIGKSCTVTALPDIIQYFNEKELKFERITKEVRPVCFNYINYK